MNKPLLCLFLLFPVFAALAQKASIVQGKVLDRHYSPLHNVIATLQSTNATAITNEEGIFTLQAPEGSHILTVTSAGYIAQSFSLNAIDGRLLDIGIIILEEDIVSERQMGLVTLTESDLADDNGGSESTAGLLQAGRTVFQQAAAFNWGQARFRIRGLDSRYSVTTINGVTMNKLYDGRPQWSNWGGLNDATRNQGFTMGAEPSDYIFGNLLGTQEISTRASSFRPGTRVSFAGTNTYYRWRSMASYASGLDNSGWAYMVSASRRWAGEAYFDGTDYSANAAFISVEKRINDRHSLNFTGIYAQSSRGRNSPNTDEVTRLTDVRYNSYWGWQNGKKRNSRDRDIEEPIVMLSHYWKINSRNTLNSNIAYQFGRSGNTRIDFQAVPNPDPSYYQNLPSFYTSKFLNDPTVVPDSAYEPGGLGGLYIGGSQSNIIAAQQAQERFVASPQIDWSAMYRANTIAVTNENNVEFGRRPGVSRYVLYEDRTDDKTWSASSILFSQLSENISFNSGISFKKVNSHNYQNLLDLLGGAYYNDMDPYYSGSMAEADLNHPGRKVRAGDIFGYNYNLSATVADAFIQFRFNYRKTDFYLSQYFSHSRYQREGLFRNGLYPGNSYGNSDRISFDNFGFKGGITYRHSGRHIFTLNGLYMTKAPALRNTFPNARLNNSVINDIQSEKIAGIDISYNLRTPDLKAKATAYYSTIRDITETSFFFAEGVFEGEGSESNAFLAETVTGLDQEYIGLELGIEYRLTAMLRLLGSAALGQFTYANNPGVMVNSDALAALEQEGNFVNQVSGAVSFGQSQMKNYKLPGVPQQAYSLGLEYRDPAFWWIGANVNYLAANYLDVSALLRTENFYQNPEDVSGFPFPEATKERARELLKQEELDDVYLVNLSGGKSWKFGNTIVGLFVNINNLFNATYKTGGFEQARNANYRQLNQDVSSGTPSFGPKYYYGYGRTYFINFYINM